MTAAYIYTDMITCHVHMYRCLYTYTQGKLVCPCCKLRNIVGIWSRFDVVVPTYMFDNVSWAYPFVINMMIDKGDSQWVSCNNLAQKVSCVAFIVSVAASGMHLNSFVSMVPLFRSDEWSCAAGWDHRCQTRVVFFSCFFTLGLLFCRSFLHSWPNVQGT